VQLDHEIKQLGIIIQDDLSGKSASTKWKIYLFFAALMLAISTILNIWFKGLIPGR